MNRIAILEEATQADLATMTADELKQALKDCCRITVEALRRAAMIVKELEGRGEDVSQLNLTFKEEMRLMAYGQTLPEVVVRFAGQRQLLKKITSLPLPDQERIAAGEPVKMVVPASGGGRTHRMVDPREMKPQQVAQVFADRSIRSEAEQILWLDHQQVRDARTGPKVIGELHIDRERGGVTVGRKFIPMCDLVAAVKALKG